MLNSFVIILCCATLLLCTPGGFAQEAGMREFDWLIGTWKRETRSGIAYERWIKVSRRTFEGDSYRIAHGDTTFLEFLRLEQFGQKIFYVPKISHNKYPVPFKLIDAGENGFVFEHPEHDFPQRIIYQPQGDGKLHVRVEGEQDGKMSGIDFNFVKAD